MIDVFIFVASVKAWSLQTVAHYTAALGGLSTIYSPQYHNTWSYKVIPTRSVFMKLPVTVAFVSGVNYPFNGTTTSIPQFSQELPWPLFHTAKISE
jgi:ABC-type maltose transport system permease subunit